MAFFKVSTNEENVRDYEGGGGYLNKSGIYEVKIKHTVVNTSPNGSTYIDLYVEYKDKLIPIFQAIRLTNNDGSANLGQALFNKLCIIAGATEGNEINEPVPATLPIGKNKEAVDCLVLEDFNDLVVYLRLQMEYSVYDGKIRENKNIRNFFRYEDKATASEIVNDAKEKGSQYFKEEEYADKVVYKDDLTEEDIKQWIQDRKSGKESTVQSTPKPSFGTKRTFGKK